MRKLIVILYSAIGVRGQQSEIRGGREVDGQPYQVEQKDQRGIGEPEVKSWR